MLLEVESWYFYIHNHCIVGIVFFKTLSRVLQSDAKPFGTNKSHYYPWLCRPRCRMSGVDNKEDSESESYSDAWFLLDVEPLLCQSRRVRGHIRAEQRRLFGGSLQTNGPSCASRMDDRISSQPPAIALRITHNASWEHKRLLLPLHRQSLKGELSIFCQLWNNISSV